MTPEQLKASILQRAMEGKLVPQNPNDEPASELLKRIKVEKEKLISEGKIKRDKKETEIFRGDDGKHYEKFVDESTQDIYKTETKLALFSSAVGLRRKEMMSIESKDLFFKNGKAYLNVTKGTKGGKPRIVEICGISEGETKMIVEWIQSREGKLFPKLNTNYDNHYYRAVYAQRLYDRYKRKEKDIPPRERYIMRKERAGEVYDKLAMEIVSKNLGHNRISVIAQSYLYN